MKLRSLWLLITTSVILSLVACNPTPSNPPALPTQPAPPAPTSAVGDQNKNGTNSYPAPGESLQGAPGQAYPSPDSFEFPYPSPEATP